MSKFKPRCQGETLFPTAQTHDSEESLPFWRETALKNDEMPIELMLFPHHFLDFIKFYESLRDEFVAAFHQPLKLCFCKRLLDLLDAG